VRHSRGFRSTSCSAHSVRRLGFDQFEGLLSSNVQLPNPYYRNERVVEASPVDQTTLTDRYTRAAVDLRGDSDES
jgi:hypothetical protein